MNNSISVINSGSSSIKFSLFGVASDDKLALVFTGQVEGIGVAPHFRARDANGKVLAENRWEKEAEDTDHEAMMTYIIAWIKEHRIERGLELLGVGHRVVHGGEAYSAPVRIDETVLGRLDDYVSLAPLHQPHNLRGIRSVARMYPDLPQVACFDTAFHATNPIHCQTYALPGWMCEEGVKRYGFHGLSYEYIASRLLEIDPKAAEGRTIVAHLGSGVSMCALKAGISVASSMGFSALDGLPMGTRTGSLDPGVILYLLQEKKMTPEAIERLLYKESGLLGLSGVSNDMRLLLESDKPDARLALDVFVYRIQREIGSLMAALSGLDTLVFTAGIGENAPPVRERVLQGLDWLGVELDTAANQAGGPCLTTPESKVAAWVIPTNEELMIATHAYALLSQPAV